jgi:hypothetical protein
MKRLKNGRIKGWSENAMEKCFCWLWMNMGVVAVVEWSITIRKNVGVHTLFIDEFSLAVMWPTHPLCPPLGEREGK